MTDTELADEIEKYGLSPHLKDQIIAALRRSEPERRSRNGFRNPERREQPSSDGSLRIFKTCEKHRDVTSWTVHPTGYAIPALEVCPVCEEIAYNLKHAAAEAEAKP